MTRLASFSDAFLATFMDDERVDGVRGISEFAAETFEQAKENKSIAIRSGLLQMMLKLMADYDERNKPKEDEKFTTIELQQRMVAAVIDEIGSNSDLAVLIGKTAIQSLRDNPAMLAELQHDFVEVTQGLIDG